MSIFKREKHYRVPGGQILKLSDAIFSAEHTLIAGTTGSGKSVLLNGIVRDLLKTHAPSEAELILLDPKYMELDEFKNLPHVLGYADTPADCESVLRSTVELMSRRNRWCKQNGKKTFTGPAVYVLIDELYPLTTGANKREMIGLLSLLLTQARAANIHIVACTQLPNRASLPANVVSLFTMRIGLRTVSSIESRQIIGISGCESLPLHGTALVLRGPSISAVSIPLTDEHEVKDIVNYWTSKRCYA